MKKLLVVILLFFPFKAFSIDQLKVKMSEKQLSSLCNAKFILTHEKYFEYTGSVYRNYDCTIKTKEGRYKSFFLTVEDGRLTSWTKGF